MSIRVTTAVWKHSRHEGAALLVLLVIADFADDQGRAWPSIPDTRATVAADRSLRAKIINTLVASGELVIETRGGGRNLSNRYRVIANPDLGVRVSEAVKHDPGDRVSTLSEGSKPGHPRPETLTSVTGNPDPQASRSVMIRKDPLVATLTPSAKLRKKTRKHAIPDDFTLTPERRAVAERAGLDADPFFAQFVDQCHAKGYLNADWDRAWSTWCRSEGLRPKSPFKAVKANTMPTGSEYWEKNA